MRIWDLSKRTNLIQFWMATAYVSDVGLEVTRKKNIRKERWIQSGGDQGQRRTLKDELGPFSLPQISHCNDVSVLWELKEQHAGLLPHANSVRQPISNMCELPLCLVSCTALLSQRPYGCFTSAFRICVPCPWCPMWTRTMQERKFWEM